MFNKILTPVDGTDISESILKNVAVLAGGLGAEVTLLSVIDPRHAEHTPDLWTHLDTGEVSTPSFQRFQEERHMAGSASSGGAAYASQVLDRAQAHLQKHLVELLPVVRGAGVEASAQVRFGYPAEEIEAFAQAGGFDLIVMATHGRNAVMRGILGGVADKVLRTSTVPVLVIKPEAETAEGDSGGFAFANILVPVDGSAHAESALPYVEDLAKTLGAKVTVLRVVPTGGPYTGLWDDARLMEAYPEVKEKASSYVDAIVSDLRKKGIAAEARVTEGLAAASVTQVADETAADAIVLAPKGLSGLSRVVLGSVTETAVRASHRPVLVIPPALAAEDLEEAGD